MRSTMNLQRAPQLGTVDWPPPPPAKDTAAGIPQDLFRSA